MTDGQDGFYGGEQEPLLLVADGAQLPERSCVHVVHGAQAARKITLRLRKLARQPQASVPICKQSTK